MSEAHLKGTQLRFTATFRNLAEALTDPTDVVFRVRSEDGSTATTTAYDYNPGPVVKDSTGIYHLDVTLDKSARWYFRAEGTGAVIVAEEESVLAYSDFD